MVQEERVVVATTKEMKWGITGGSGQLAQSLGEILTKKGINYIKWNHDQIDIADSNSINKISEFQPDVLVNCAAWTNVDRAEDSFEQALKVNRDGASNVALVAKELNIPLLHISTDYVFSGEKSHPWLVEDDTNPATKYGQSKMFGEQKIQEIWREKSYVVRTAWLYGPYGKNFAKTIVKKLLSTGDAIQVVNDQTGQPTSTFDLADRIINVIDSNLPAGVYHATNSGQATWWEFAKELALLSEADIDRIIPVPSQLLGSSTMRPEYSVLDHSQWSRVGLNPMRNWRLALQKIFPKIRSSVMKELNSD